MEFGVDDRRNDRKFREEYGTQTTAQRSTLSE
jgi:hypothetical protein